MQLGDIIVFLVGTKSDLCRSEFLDDASQYAQSRQIPFVITSAKTGSGVSDLMDLLGTSHFSKINRSHSCLTIILATFVSIVFSLPRNRSTKD
jgi:hypothetical protein